MPSRRSLSTTLLSVVAIAAVSLISGLTAPGAAPTSNAGTSLSASAHNNNNNGHGNGNNGHGNGNGNGKSGTVTIYLTRHGETWMNVGHRMQGWSDSPLTTNGELVATQLGVGLAKAGVKFDSAYSADMLRHSSTAALALAQVKFKGEAVRDPGLREVAFGSFEGALQSEAQKAAIPYLKGTTFNDFLDALVAANTAAGSPLLAETAPQLTVRTMASLNAIAAKQSKSGGGNVLVVSSGITIIAALEAMGADTSGLTTGIGNAAVNKLEYKNGKWTVLTMNDLSYVEAGSK